MGTTTSLMNIFSAMILILFTFLGCCTLLPYSISAAKPTSPRPDINQNATFARWMINQGKYGVLTTLDPQNAPFGNVMSYSDGATGVPYFFLTTTLDPTGIYALKNPSSSLTLSERQIGTCDESKDAQLPDCAKITLSGKLRLLAKESEEAKFAKSILFAEHPRFGEWPTKKGTGFQFFLLDIEQVFLVNTFKPFKNISLVDYFRANVSGFV